MLKKIPAENITVTNAIFFLSRAPTHHSSNFNSWNFTFSIPLRFYKSLYFCLTKCMDSLTLKRQNSFQN